MENISFTVVEIGVARDILTKAAQNNLNVLVMSDPGYGKTSMGFEVAKNLSMKYVYYSVPTLDPWTDLVGIPVPKDNHLEFVRKIQSEDCEIMMLDEFNATAHYKTINALKELLVLKSINGVSYPKLKSIFAFMNPPDSQHSLFTLDQAIMERFQIKIQLDKKAEIIQLEKVGINKPTAEKMIQWNNNLQNKYSPRMLEYVYRTWEAGIDPIYALGDITDAASLKSLLNNYGSILYSKEDLFNGKLLADLEKDKTNTSIAFVDLIKRVKLNRQFWMSIEFTTIFPKLSPDTQSLMKSFLQSKFSTTDLAYYRELEKCLNFATIL